MSLNKVQIIGRMAANPDIRSTQNGKVVANFRVGVNSKSKDGDKTEWFRVVAWDKTAEIVRDYFKKGNLVYVEGRQETREWEKDEVKHQTPELVAQNVQNLSPKDQGLSEEDRQSVTNPVANSEPVGWGTF